MRGLCAGEPALEPPDTIAGGAAWGWRSRGRAPLRSGWATCDKVCGVPTARPVRRAIRLSAVITLTSAVLATAQPAADRNDDRPVTVRRFTFIGVRSIAEDRLRAVLATRQSSRVPWGSKTPFDRGRLDADLRRIAAFYADRGYPDARVMQTDVRPTRTPAAVDVQLTVEEGEPVRVSSVDLRGFEIIPPDRLSALTGEAPVKVGEPRDRVRVANMRELVLNELREHGYPFAKVSVIETAGPGGERQVAVAYLAEPGPLARFGAVEITGNSAVTDRVIRRQLTFRPGDLYRRSLVQGSQRRLYGMELFQFVNIETIEPERLEPVVRSRVTVHEGKHQRVNFGVGYGTEEKLRGEGEYHHLNFLGGARTAGAHGRWSSLDRGVRLDFIQPYFLGPRASLGADAQQWWTYTPAYTSVVTGAKTAVTRRPTQSTSWSVSFTAERSSSTISEAALLDDTLKDDLIALGLDPTTGSQAGTFTALGFDYQRSTADNVLDSHRGYQLAFHAEHAAPWLPGSFSYSAVSADMRHYLSLSESIVVASRAQIGAIHPLDGDQSNVPFSKKYFLGGATSVRGWGRFEVSPLLDGVPIGGLSLLAASAELRARVNGRLGGVVFVDAGNVWDDEWHFALGELQASAGVGIRYRTPVGPIRFDFGYQLTSMPALKVNGAPQLRPWRLHFSIGQAF